jgi:hypothetical protein
MPRIKTILCSGIFIFFFTALTAQVTFQKEKTISNVIDQYVYQQKHRNIQQVLKDSVLFKYELDLHYSAYLTISHLSRIYISFINCLIPPPPSSTVSEKLQSHLQTSLLVPYTPYTYRLLWSTSCWDRDVFQKAEASFSNRTFFKYQ